jgi:hypothetical protein
MRTAAWVFALSIATFDAAWSQSSNGGSAGATAPSDAPYVDNLIEGGNLAVDRETAEDAAYDESGWPRYWHIDGVAGYYNQNGQITRENGFRLGASIDTPQYGALTFEGTVRIQPGGGIATLLQRDLPFDNNWRANNGLGIVITPGIDLSRAQYRFYIPTFPVLGGTTEWIRDGDLQFQASAGEPGNFNGLRLSGFTSLNGSLYTAGAQWAFAPQWQAGVQITAAQGVDSPFAGLGSSGSVNTQAAFAALAWTGDSTRLQANLVASDASDSLASRRAIGLWLDGNTTDSSYNHHYGIFRLEPGLAWGYLPINNDIEGGYYRGAFLSPRWQADGGFDLVRSVSGNGASGFDVTGNARYQFTTRFGIGGNGMLVQASGHDAWTASTYADYVWAAGTSQLQGSVANDNGLAASRAYQLALSHTWNTPVGSRLSTSITTIRDTTQGMPLRTLGLGLVGGGDLGNNLSLDANLQYNLLRGGGSASAVYGNVVLNWQFSTHWSLSATYYNNRDSTAKLFLLDSLIPTVNPIPVARNQAFYMTLRYADRAGAPQVPLGGRQGGAAGDIIGYLYLDTNDNGRRDPGEPGAANVTVLLDGRFSTRTNDAGRFEFPFVSVGSHRITVVPDNLPLPWSVTDDTKREIYVSARETVTIEIGARRLR